MSAIITNIVLIMVVFDLTLEMVQLQLSPTAPFICLASLFFPLLNIQKKNNFLSGCVSSSKRYIIGFDFKKWVGLQVWVGSYIVQASNQDIKNTEGVSWKNYISLHETRPKFPF